MTSPSGTEREQPEFTRGRIRVERDDAILLAEALDRDINRMLDARNELIDEGIDEGRAMYNRNIARLRRVLAEMERTALDKGWTEVIEAIVDMRGGV